MRYLTAKQLSEKWGITERRIIKLCKENRINGVMKNGMVWLIPEDAMKPSDKRNKISKYINTQKRAMIVNINNEVGKNLVPLLKKEGYIVDGICGKKGNVSPDKFEDIKLFNFNYENRKGMKEVLEQTEKYYDALIFIDLDKKSNTVLEKKKNLINEFAKKMNCESAIILVNVLKNVETKFENVLSEELKKSIGLRINAINIDISPKSNLIINYDEISEDILALLTRFKNTTGMAITTDGGAIKFDKNGRTDLLEVGEFYKVINSYFKKLDKNSYMWCASIMLEDEWTEEPLEMNFRVINLEAANRGANIERIFIFSKSRIKEFKENKTLKIYMQSNIKTMFVDYDEIQAKEPEILEIVGDGWDGIDTETLIVDLPSKKYRGYVSRNKEEVLKAYNCFKTLKKYSKNLKEVLKS